MNFVTHQMPDTFSGWKAHVFCTSTVESGEILADVLPHAWENGWGVKEATASFHEICGPSHRQHGKGVTIYFPRLDSFDEDLRVLLRLVRNVSTVGVIAGDHMLSDNVGVRDEFGGRGPGWDVDESEYHNYYVPA